MTCICCGKAIKPKEPKAYAYMGQRRKTYACWSCNESGAFDAWLDNYQYPLQYDSDTAEAPPPQ